MPNFVFELALNGVKFEDVLYTTTGIHFWQLEFSIDELFYGVPLSLLEDPPDSTKMCNCRMDCVDGSLCEAHCFVWMTVHC